MSRNTKYDCLLVHRLPFCYTILLLFISSCIGKGHPPNEINIKVYASEAKGKIVTLAVDDKLIVSRQLRPYREVYERVTVMPEEGDSVKVYYRVGDRDTTFTFVGQNQTNYSSIQYSRWWNKFFITKQDSTSYYSGGADVVYYD